MSTSPDTVHRADDQIVTLLSQWLARHVSDEELRRRVEAIGTDELSPAQAEAVGELQEAVREGREAGGTR